MYITQQTKCSIIKYFFYARHIPSIYFYYCNNFLNKISLIIEGESQKLNFICFLNGTQKEYNKNIKVDV